ncbi:hypothetical protein LFML04_0628 [Leptospirillum ferriphilum ML-04]|uniref:Uncharacterized protein n=2 Tax=Leptospirillum ferriphilum TaxID=178606 RepID=J9ZAI2_LEPFM|nr:hypothetical protein LFML04_0628 [Leptospirillum ferriphilum ML-04]
MEDSMNAKKGTNGMLNLNFPKETALPEKPVWKENAPEEGTGGLSVLDSWTPLNRIRSGRR